MRNNIIYIPILCAFMACLGLLVACSAGPSDKPIVTVSIEPQKYLLEQITGDRVEIRTLIANGANPETYDPSLTHVLNLSKSIGFLRMGNIGFEAAMLDKIRQEDPELPIFNTSLGVLPVTVTHSHGDVSHETIDPHTWSSVKNAKIIVRNMLNAMVEIDPANKGYYQRNYDRFANHLDSLDNSTPKEAIDHASDHGAKVFFYQKDFDSRQAESMVEQLEIRKVSINPLAYEWEDEIVSIADAIAGNGTL